MLDEVMKSSDILFADDTVVIHISGNVDNWGKIIKTNQSLVKLFGYTKVEVVGHSINILMPSLFGKRHNEFLQKFFETGYQIMFNKERILYGLHRSRYCFCIKIFVKQFPNLEEGMQYVAMIRSTQTDSEYILTDTKGVIDTFSQGLSTILNLPISLFNENGLYSASCKKQSSLKCSL